MPVQTPQWMDVLCCCICFNGFDNNHYQPVSLVCCHTACRACLLKLKTKQCPFDQSAINVPVADLPINSRILKILDVTPSVDLSKIRRLFEKCDVTYYIDSVAVLESLCIYLKRAPSEKGAYSSGTIYSEKLSRPMQRKLINLICCNLVEPEGRARALKSIRSLGERCLTELLLLHQNPYHLSSNLWATVRARGCQFLGPAMQEEVLKLVLLALSEGALISRKVLVMYIVQTLEKEYPQASKTSVGHVVQLLYRASCFNVIKRDAESSLMQLKEEFRFYDALRREHDAQIVQIAMEAGLRISPDQWSALLYGDQAHKSHMQSIIDKLQSPQSFSQCIQELLISLQRTGDPGHLVDLRPYFENLAEIDVMHGDNNAPSWQQLLNSINGIKVVIDGQVKFCDNYGGPRAQRETTEHNVVAYKFKTSMCRDIGEGKSCMRGETCTFAHSIEEMERYRARSRLMGYKSKTGQNRSRPLSSSHAPESTLMHDGEFYDISNESGDPNSSFGSVADYWNAPFEMPVTNAFLLQHQPTLLNRCPIARADATSSPVTVITNAGIEQVMQAPIIPAAVSPVTVIAAAAGPVIAATSNLANQFPMENGQIAAIGAVPYQMIQGPAALPPYNPLIPPSAASPPIPVNTALPPPQPSDVPFFWASVPGKLMQVELSSIPAAMMPLGQPELSKYFNQAATVQSMQPP
uniref:RING-type E3 ubiquitin transferase n=1 Tax=Romanomermis culicivorax TaxID=13658 RepID=A0A915IP87_ROMCU